MAWFGDGLPRLSDLKGQLTNFTKEVLSEGIIEEIGEDRSQALNEANEKIGHLQEELNSKDAEISFLRRQNCKLEKTVVELNSKPTDANDASQDETGDAFFWDPPSANSRNTNKQRRKMRLLQNQLAQATVRIQDLESELKRVHEDSNWAWRNEFSDENESTGYVRPKEGLLNRITEVDEEEHEQNDEASLIDDFHTIVSKLGTSGRHNLVEDTLRAIDKGNKTNNVFDNADHDTTNQRQNGPYTVASERECELQQKIEELQEENGRLITSMELLDQDHNEAIDKVLSLKENLEAEHQSLQAAYSKLDASHSQALEKVTQLENAQLLKENEKMKQVEIASQIVQTLMPETNEKDVQTESVRMIKEETKSANIDELSNKIKNALNRKIAAQHGETFFNALIEDYNGLLQAKIDLEGKIEGLHKELENVRGRQDSVVQESGNKQSLIDALELEIGKLRDENSKLQTTAELYLEKQADSKEEEISELKKRIIGLEESEYACAEELRISKDRCKYFEKEAQELEKNIKVIQGEKNQVEHALTRSRQASIEAWNDMQKSIQAEKSLAREATNNLVSHARNLESELSKQIETVTQEKHDLLEEAVAREKDLDEIMGELSEIKEEYKTLKSEISTMCMKILESENETLTKVAEGKNEVELVKSVIERFDTLQNDFRRITNEVEDLRLKEKELMVQQENVLKVTEQNSHLTGLIQQLQEKCQDLHLLVERLENEKEKSIIDSKVDTVDIEKQQIAISLEERTRETEILKNDNALLMKEINEMQSKLQEAIESNNESTDMAKQTIESLSHLIKEKDEEINSLRSDLNLMKNKSSDESNSFATIKNERDELAKLVTHKHNESLQYHAEIQRLTQVLTEQSTRIRELISEQKESASTLEQKDAEIYWTRNELQVVQQRLKNMEEAQGDEKKCLIIEHSTQLAEIAVLNEKCNALEAALIQEQSNTRLLQNQLTEKQSKEVNTAKELERLRNHLVEMESSYTEEALIAEDMRKELESKLSLAEEKIKNSSTAYTSANIRANQQVETLHQQMLLIIQQRDDIQNKLLAAEDKVLSQTASLTNLQIVLEQFQTDKDRDVVAATQRIQNELKGSYNRQEELMNEIINLKEQLAEAKECLQAASRLSEQLDKKTERIEQLTQEVERLSELANTSDQRMQQAKQDEQSKVDKALIKNLLLGYLASSTADKPSVLRVFATILDFNDAERDKTGLSHSSSNHGWFARLSGGSLPTTKDQEASLSAAFVRFLESESKPKPQLPALPIQSTSLPKPGHSRQPSTSSTQSALLLSNVDLPTFPDFIPARNTGSILKEVLKDS